VVFGRLATTVLAVVTLKLMLVTSAAATTLSYQDGVFRHRAEPGRSNDIALRLSRAKTDGTPARLSGFSTSPVRAGPGCRAAPSRSLGDVDDFFCLLTASGLPRYRLVLSDREDDVTLAGLSLRGVIYGGRGSDRVHGSTWRVYGGRGDDSLDGQRVYGGPGDDRVRPGVLSEAGRRSVLRGGTGDDIVDAYPGPAWGYGGPGRDELRPSPRRDMLVGGRGRDLVDFVVENTDKSADTFRIRGGGHDTVFCNGDADRRDVFFADRSDELDLCGDARLLFTGRPQIFR
jgi:Ca2+-binding RTX toxin-like protein